MEHWREITQEEWHQFAHDEESAGEDDDGDDLNWEYDPSVKENHGKL